VLDDECERVAEELLLKRRGIVAYPISTDDLLFALDHQASVDHYADLDSDASGEIWGVTKFVKEGKPEVRINRRLSENPRLENPYRTTITHESAHVRFHGLLFATIEQTPRLFEDDNRNSQTCNRLQVESSAPYDWIEWQASYCSGALLMPVGAVRKLVTMFLRDRSVPVAKLRSSSRHGEGLVEEVMAQFKVSSLAAKVRLTKLGFLTDSEVVQPSLLT
jgi:Zn-dependent peptidase ImmA (M78 family)